MKVAAYTQSYYDEITNSMVLTPVSKSLVSLENKNDTSAMEVNKKVNYLIEDFFSLNKESKQIKVIFDGRETIMNIVYYSKNDMYKFKISSTVDTEIEFWKYFKKCYKLEYFSTSVSVEKFVSKFGVKFIKREENLFELAFMNNNPIDTYVLADSDTQYGDTKFKNSSSRNPSEITSILNFFKSIKEQIMIPHYQRDYMWDETQVTQLITDLFYTIAQNKHGVKYNHFLGNIVLTRKENDKLNLVDGQQRLTTFMLLFFAINKVYDEKDKSLLNIIYTHDHKLKVNQKKYASEAIREQFDNNKIFDSNNRISINVNQIRKLLKESLYTREELIENGLANMYIQKLILPNEFDENTVFETLNARGLELSNYDLIKAFMFAFEGYNRHIYDFESHIENKDNRNMTINVDKMHDLIRDYLAMKTGKLYSKSRVDTKEQTLYIGYKEYVNSKYNITKMTEATYEVEYKSLLKFKQAGDRLEQLKKTYCEIIPLQKYYKESNSLLKTLCYVETKESRVKDGLDEYSSYIVRKCLMNGKNTSWEHAKTANYLFENHTSTFCSSEIIRKLKEENDCVFKFKVPIDRKIISVACDNDYTNKAATFLYSMLESKVMRHGATYTFQKVSAEHIYPQTAKDMVSEEADKLVNRLGNFCLLDGKSNSEVQNSTFQEKLKSKKYQTSVYLYTNQIQDNGDYKFLDIFNERAINSRTRQIIEEILEKY